MRIAYIILAHRYPQHLIRLVSRLESATARFYIHVDSKTDPATYAAMTGGLAGRPNVQFLTRHRCNWGDFGLVRATLTGIAAIQREAWQPAYVVLLTGQDYPLKPNHELDRFFREHNGQAFMFHERLPAVRWANEDGGFDRLWYWHFRLAGRRLAFPAPDLVSGRVVGRLWRRLARRLPLRRLPAGIEWHGGSAHWCLPIDCIDYLHQFTADRPDIVRFFESTRIPDELFFQTVLMNSPLRERVVNADLRCMLWRRDLLRPGPETLRVADFDHLAQSGRLFARKFDPTVDTSIMDMIDTRLLDGPPHA